MTDFTTLAMNHSGRLLTDWQAAAALGAALLFLVESALLALLVPVFNGPSTGDGEAESRTGSAAL